MGAERAGNKDGNPRGINKVNSTTTRRRGRGVDKGKVGGPTVLRKTRKRVSSDLSSEAQM